KENGDTDFADCELAWTNFDGPVRLFKFRWAGMLQGDMANKEERVHPTQKPVALAKWVFDKFKISGFVLDLFGGSGSTLLACEQMGLTAALVEREPRYCDVIIERWQKLTGKQAVLESGETFDAKKPKGNMGKDRAA
ncbi:MAG: site-specific DNA-methyltransferase, partial [Alphaproteobacteria bacterium]|nr:site-specific DNA-methyltransferase [Alphaproteobacteria bacterium]